MKNIRIPVDNIIDDKCVRISLEQDFDNLEILSLKLTSSDAYRRMCSDFGVLVGRVSINNGFGVQNAKVSIFVPITQEDQNRNEITQIYPFKSYSDTYPNGVRYNLLPRVRNSNPSHIAVGNFPDITDFSNYPQSVEIFEKYYKYTTVTNNSGDYMIFGIPLGTQTVHMDFDLFDTPSLELTANDLVKQTITTNNLSSDVTSLPGFIYKGNGDFVVEPSTDISSMPNIFSGFKTINIAPFWGDNNFCDVGITRCDFKINYRYQPTAIFFGYLNSVSHGYVIDQNYRALIDNQPEIHAIDSSTGQLTGDLYPYQEPVVVIYKLDDDGYSRKRVGVYKCQKDTGIFKISLPMYMDYYTTNDFGDVIPTNNKNIGIATKGYYSFEFYESNEVWYDRREPQGGFWNRILPGIRVPSSIFGDPSLGGWEDIKTSLFSYDIINKKRKYYTIKSTYHKHKKDNVSDTTGNIISWFPQTNINKIDNIFWNFPIDYRDVPNISDVSLIGSILVPRLLFQPQGGARSYSIDSDVIGPVGLLNIKYIDQSDSYGYKIKLYESLLGIGVNKNGLNNGQVYESIFSDQSFIYTDSNGISVNTFGENTTWGFGDNEATTPILNEFALKLSLSPDSTANSYGIQSNYTQSIDKQYTYGAFINSTTIGNGVVELIDTSIYDITDELTELINNGVYSSFLKGDVTEFNTDFGTPTHYKANQYNGNFYYFGAGKNQNALIDIKEYFYNKK